MDTLLKVFAQPLPIPPATIVAQLEELILVPSAAVQPTVRARGMLTEPSL